ncbi:MAG: hypothetical protein NVSMB23_07800 [Myxococcales bacterium]
MQQCRRFLSYVTIVIVACGGGGRDGGQILKSGFDVGVSLPPPAAGPPGSTPPGSTPPGAPPAGADAGSPPSGGTPPPSTGSCLAAPLLAQLGSRKLRVGADMSDAVAKSAPFDVRYLYLSGGLADGSGPCNSCASQCTAAGASCSTAAGGCAWWGCWQDDSKAPGKYVRDLLAKTKAAGQIPMITYYELLHTSKVAEGPAEVAAVAGTELMTRFFNDFRLVLQQVGGSVALLHVEPDFWGYAQQANPDPHAIPAAVARANPADCGGQENSVAGLGRCLFAMARRYAPNAKVGLHGSGWATRMDVTQNRDPSLDVAAEGRKLGDFLLACGAGDSDFVAIDASDRDSGFARSQGRETFWDPTDKTLPSFRQAFTWAAALTARLGRPALWWQVPLGNMSLPNVVKQWQDNRVDYFFSHPADVARTNAFGMVFGPGESRQTSASTDGGNFVGKVRALASAGGQPACF